MKNICNQCAILMAGKGTRFLPATKAIPKEVFPIFNKPTLLYNLKEIYDSGVRKVALVISEEKEYVIKSFLSHNKKIEDSIKGTSKEELLKELNEIIDNMDITYVFQSDKMIGSGGAVYALKDWANGQAFGVLNGDDLCINDKDAVIGQLIKAYEETGLALTACKEKPIEVVPNYSSAVVEKKLSDRCFKISAIIEKPKNPPTNLVSLARYILTPEIFDVIEKTEAVGGEIRLTDSLNEMAKQGKVGIYNFDGIYYDGGSPLELTKCIIETALKDKAVKAPLIDYMKEIIANENK